MARIQTYGLIAVINRIAKQRCLRVSFALGRPCRASLNVSGIEER
jgi:hypothetical protein